jgi:aspartyl-tRNA synthetase
MLRTHTCGALRAGDIGSEVTLAGWVHRRRDHGGLLFVDVRDRDGLTQVVFDPETSDETFQAAHSLGQEWVVAVDGRVRARPEGQANTDLATGGVEVVASAMRVLNPSRTPPFEVSRELDLEETSRLRHRYLDLRRARMQRNLRIRHEATRFAREFLNDRAFLEVETPILLKATPEGARDFIVPSRLQPGRFYALPQSPQQMKQLLMVAGVDRYYQMARCFRDEDLRADRQLEFTQLDIEMSFVEMEDMLQLNEELALDLFRTVAPHLRLQAEVLPRITHADAMARYGTDKPDLRYGLPIADVSELAAKSEFRVFRDAVAGGGVVRAIAAPTAFSRREVEQLEASAKSWGAGGLAWLAFDAGEVRGSVAKQLTADEIAAIRDATGATEPSTVLIVAGPAAMAAPCLGRLRQDIAKRLDLIPSGVVALCWLIDPPLVEWNADESRWDPAHHPFTAPRPEDEPLLTTDPGAVRALAYDLIGNGYELSGGSIRIHTRAIQEKVFSAIGLAPDEVTAKFGHLLEAFELGAPPHGGIAYGWDRVVMVMAEEDSIREVIPFPKTLTGSDPMLEAPDDVPAALLAELGLKLAE